MANDITPHTPLFIELESLAPQLMYLKYQSPHLLILLSSLVTPMPMACTLLYTSGCLGFLGCHVVVQLCFCVSSVLFERFRRLHNVIVQRADAALVS